MTTRFFLLLALLGGMVAPLQAAERLALLIGNRNYIHVPDLRNTHNDVDEMAKRLQRLGFEITLVKDAHGSDLQRALLDFGRRARRAKMALVFYSGHGIQVQGENYLIPVDAELRDDWDLQSLLPLGLRRLMAAASQAQQLSLVILDACRENPFNQRLQRDATVDSRTLALDKGLAPVEATPPNQLVWFAAEDGEVASDGVGSNSPFTAALLEQLDHNAGLDVRKLFGGVIDSVERRTSYRQRPFSYGSIRGTADTCLGPCQSVVRVDPLARERQLGLGAAEWLNIQRRLQGLGFDPGLVDGYPGSTVNSQTRQALMGYQRQKGDPVTGYLTPDQAAALQLASMPPPPQRRPFEPEMVPIPAGRFTMGSPASEGGREDDEGQRQVSVAAFEIGKYEVTVGQFRQFVEATGYRTEAERNVEQQGCFTWSEEQEGGEWWGWRSGHSWRSPGFTQGDDHPVVCVSWNDATAYLEWLSRETGQAYRLPTEAEWEYMARAGTQTSRYWGDDADEGCAYGNVADQTRSPHRNLGWDEFHDCSDGHFFTAPVGRYRGNSWSLHDVLGNVWEWTCSVYTTRYNGSEESCSETTSDVRLALRGGAWNSVPRGVRSANRDWFAPWYRFANVGFRPARSL